MFLSVRLCPTEDISLKISNALAKVVFVASLVTSTSALAQDAQVVVSPGRQFEERTALLKEIQQSKDPNLLRSLLSAFKNLDDSVKSGSADLIYIDKETTRLRSIAQHGGQAAKFESARSDLNAYLRKLIGKVSTSVPAQAKLSSVRVWFLLQTDGSVSRLTSLSKVTSPADLASQTAILSAVKRNAPFVGFPDSQADPVEVTFWFANGKAQTSTISGDNNSEPPIGQDPAKTKILEHCSDLITKQKSSEAILELNKFLQTNPNVAEGYYLRARAYVEMKDNPRAVAEYSKAIKADPKDRFNYLELARLHRRMGRKDLAVQILSAGVANAKDANQDCLGDRAEVLASQEKYAEALTDANKILNDNLTEVNRLEKTKVRPAALKRAQKKLANAYFRRALVFDQAHRYDEEINDWGKVIDRFQIDAACAYNNRGLANQHLGRWEEALSDMNNACGQAPFHSDHFINRAKLKVLLSKTETLNSEFKEALRLANEKIAKDKATDVVTSEDLSSRGAAYVGLSQFNEALVDAREAISLDPTNEDAYLVSGDASRGLEKFDDAIEAYSKAIALAPRDPEPLVRRAKVHNRIGASDKGAADSAAATKLGYIAPPTAESIDTAGGAK